MTFFLFIFTDPAACIVAVVFRRRKAASSCCSVGELHWHLTAVPTRPKALPPPLAEHDSDLASASGGDQ